MHNQFINLTKKRKRSGKFLCRLFAFLCISAAAQGGAYGFCRVPERFAGG
jgi:hypothetical protein